MDADDENKLQSHETACGRPMCDANSTTSITMTTTTTTTMRTMAKKETKRSEIGNIGSCLAMLIVCFCLVPFPFNPLVRSFRAEFFNYVWQQWHYHFERKKSLDFNLSFYSLSYYTIEWIFHFCLLAFWPRFNAMHCNIQQSPFRMVSFHFWLLCQ